MVGAAGLPPAMPVCAARCFSNVAASDCRIQTHGLFVPNEARYQTALRPDMLGGPGKTGCGERNGDFALPCKWIFLRNIRNADIFQTTTAHLDFFLFTSTFDVERSKFDVPQPLISSNICGLFGNFFRKKSRRSMASTGRWPERPRRMRWILCSMWSASSNSSRRVPDLKMSTAG